MAFDKFFDLILTAIHEKQEKEEEGLMKWLC